MSESAPTPSPSLYERINRVKKDIERIKKTGKNQHFGYYFATESDIADALRPFMAAHGVCLAYLGPDPERTKMESAGKTIKGAERFRYTVWTRYDVVNAENPSERFSTLGIGEALDQEDKGFNKAITAAHKYVLIKLFDVSTGDLVADPDSSDHMNDGGPAKAATTGSRAVQAREGTGGASDTKPTVRTPGPKQRVATKVRKWSGVKPEDVKRAIDAVAKKVKVGAMEDYSEDELARIEKFVDESIENKLVFAEAIA